MKYINKEELHYHPTLRDNVLINEVSLFQTYYIHMRDHPLIKVHHSTANSTWHHPHTPSPDIHHRITHHHSQPLIMLADCHCQCRPIHSLSLYTCTCNVCMMYSVHVLYGVQCTCTCIPNTCYGMWYYVIYMYHTYHR